MSPIAAALSRAGTDLRRREVQLGLLHVVTLACLAVAQPLLNLLAQYPEFFVARGAGAGEILFLAFFVVLAVPLPLLALELVAIVLGERARRGIHALIVALLCAAVVLPVLKRLVASAGGLPQQSPLLFGIAMVVAAFLLGAAATAAYLRLAPARLFVTVLSPILLISPGVFLADGSIRPLLFPEHRVGAAHAVEVANPAPVVMVIFDELSLYGLMDRAGGMDGTAFPSFAALARDATWYRGASTVADGTVYSLPAMVSGRYPVVKPGDPNLFTTLAGVYDLKVFEPFTKVCSEKVCPPVVREDTVVGLGLAVADATAVYLNLLVPEGLVPGLPDITQGWDNFMAQNWVSGARRKGPAGNPSRDPGGHFQSFLNAIEPGDRPIFYFMHNHLPHMPYRFLPTGQSYLRAGFAGLNSKNGRWGKDAWAVSQGFQRFLLQLGFADRLLGQLLETLRTKGLYDRALVIVTSDHGVSHRPGDRRRIPTKTNYDDILRVPLLIKLPNQQEGAVSDVMAETIDIVPTIASVLGFELPYKADGSSLLGRNSNVRAVRKVYDRRKKLMPFPLDFQGRGAALGEKERLFGHKKGPERFYRMGPHGGLIGKRAAGLVGKPRPDTHVEIDDGQLLEAVTPGAEVMPSHITGTLTVAAPPAAPLDLALAVNGTVQAVTRTFLPNARELRFSAFVPPQVFKPGSNKVEVYVISPRRDGTVALFPVKQLAEFAGNAGPPYRLDLESEPAAIVAPDGARIRIVPGRLKGWLDSKDQGEGWVRYNGWAFDTGAKRTPERLLLFVDGTSVATVGTHIARPDVAAIYGAAAKEAGFAITLPKDAVRGGWFSKVNLFAASHDGVASELEYYAGFHWGW